MRNPFYNNHLFDNYLPSDPNAPNMAEQIELIRQNNEIYKDV